MKLLQKLLEISIRRFTSLTLVKQFTDLWKFGIHKLLTIHEMLKNLC